MGHVRTFYGHEGVVPPLGLVPAAADADDAPEVILAEAIELPSSRAKVAELDAFAEEHGIVFPEGADKLAKREAIEEWAASLPELGADDDGDLPAEDDATSTDDEE